MAMALVSLIYGTGLDGGWLFDDYPNIVDNQGVHPVDASVASLVRAALSSPASEFKRPLASLSFAANYLASGLNPYSWKLTNLVIHLANGVLVFLLAHALLAASKETRHRIEPGAGAVRDISLATFSGASRTRRARRDKRAGIVAALIAAAWMLLPINLTAVLYVVQRMESMANLFVLLGLVGYVAGRRSMLAIPSQRGGKPEPRQRMRSGFALCAASITLPAAFGLLAKETAVMLPLYAALIEWAVFGFSATTFAAAPRHRDRQIVLLFVLVLMLPMVIGLTWLVPQVLKPESWATRDFDLGTRLLSETRIVVDYLVWTLLPTPNALSFYHDDFRISDGLLTPPSTLVSILFLIALVALTVWLKKRRPLAALGIALFLGCQLLTGTILPLELIYEHRNYFASFGLLLTIVPLLAAPASTPKTPIANARDTAEDRDRDALPFPLPRYVLLGSLMMCWTALTAFTAHAWSDPLRLAEDLASRAPQSPRAQYELGRTYIIYSHYDPASPFTHLAYAPLEASAALPNSSVLPEQALIFMNSRMGLPLKDTWWDNMIAKLKAHAPGVQDESSLGALTQCVRDGRCQLPFQRMVAAFDAALAHPNPSSRLLAIYGDYAWNVLDNRELGLKMTEAATVASPDEPAYRITLIRMLIAQHQLRRAKETLHVLRRLNVGGRLDRELSALEYRLSEAARN
ncbi:hypothetical protein I6J77_04580 [Rhodanobacter sp. FDAARGOS 1247]|uniref:hypothetical protein n=1 Tax=Rhodanobacter sp. FDAARGOS 1247 TaxID=2778082 RepID=UPI0019518A9F|nr:hypothetical protein [Rhodanobacter sp. FDAARGOS 1247]QRP65581.1 hypothetical protein I6J77_04580 [Rhodanobacter sp. FDAARGOS 1247]